ncbi:MAG TPA: hypothetical protein VGQ06_12695 [Gemmatimonadales bacterium]|jgi:F-type H+-transporting ATPase subunit epsilon|nr:hypothetical protein [Gemmatimonadales bacterium]
MHVTVISPERSLFEGEADAVIAPAFDGQVGILPRHAPFLTLLGEGRLTIRATRGSERGEGGGGGGGGGGGAGPTTIEVAGGFLQVVGDAVRVVVARAT